MATTKNGILREATLGYLASINAAAPPEPSAVEEDLLGACVAAFVTENAIRKKNNMPLLSCPKELLPWQIAMIVRYLNPVNKIRMGSENNDPDLDILALYQDSGENKGLYVTEESAFSKLFRSYNHSITDNGIKETMSVLRDIAPTVYRCDAKNLIAVNNGIFNYDSKELLPFSPELVFMTKSRVNYNPLASNTIIHNPEDGTDWDIESWMKELSDDPEIVELLWEILGAIIRPLVPWNKSAWFYSDTGNNGKGTLCELMRQLSGEGSYASIPLVDMGKEFALEPLIRATAIIVDENDVGTYIDKAANLKAIITGDVININRKFKTPIPYKHHGFMVQCLNELPRIKDQSNSFFRRQLFIPFTKCFTGRERKYIKDEYLHRQDVLEYVLYRVLHMNYYQLSEPMACKMALAEYKEYNDPIMQFAKDILPDAKWSLLPTTLLYPAYRKWNKLNNPSGSELSRNAFYKKFQAVLRDFPGWAWADGDDKISANGRMEVCEPMLETYDLYAWMNEDYAYRPGASTEDRCTPKEDQYKNKSYRGAYRVGTASMIVYSGYNG